MKWLGNVRVPPQTMADLSDAEWYEQLKTHHGEEKIHIGEPQSGGNPWHTAAYWDAKGLVGLYLDE